MNGPKEQILSGHKKIKELLEKSQVPHCFTDGQRDEVSYLVVMLLKWEKIEIR